MRPGGGTFVNTRPSRRLELAAAAVLLFGSGLGVLAAQSIPTLGPPLPPQPGAPSDSGGCSDRRGAATLAQEQSVAMLYRADLRDPCVLYRSGDPQTVERSNDGGKTWRLVFK